MQPSEIVLIGVFLSGIATFLLRSGRREQGLPPGPPTVPVLGNTHLLGNGKDLHLRITQWAGTYGDIFSLKLSSRTMIVLSSATAIKEVVDKKGWAGSSRPGNYIAEICGTGADSNLLFATDGPRLKNLRRTLARFFSVQNAPRYMPTQAAESTILLHDLMVHPQDFFESIRRYTYSLTKIMTYGRRAPSFADDDVQQFYSSVDKLSHVLAPGVYPLFDIFPLFQYLPVPSSAPWRVLAHRVKTLRAGLHTNMCDSVRCGLTAGNEQSAECFIGTVLRSDVPEREHHFYSYTGIALLDAGSDPTAAFLLSLVLVLAVYPECQMRAWKEIDELVGATHLPTPADLAGLPYIRALIKETLRFRPQFPMGVHHLMTDETTYKGHHVPKGSIVVLNTYGIFHDPDVFEDPWIFNPERFLKSEHGTRPGRDANFRDNLIFGGGRRVCPGQSVGRSTMELTAMRLIWGLKFSGARDPVTGAFISRELDCYSSDLIMMPRSFICTMEPRSSERRDVVLQALGEARLYLNRFEGN
ncbi:cytochrome P450 [Mycena alexandri]|uniref:Cytochrome P450 n=1 Tax=Mycena alexandri TaxID=1745969 RepID=A0AAD6WVC3_9AGAR|nr:cytochrome P450 [Mycena alexandri]